MVTIDLRLINYKCSIDSYHKISPKHFLSPPSQTWKCDAFILFVAYWISFLKMSPLALKKHFAENMINELIAKHQPIDHLLLIAVRNYKQQAFKKYTSHLFVLIPRVLTELSLSSVWALQVSTCFLLPYIQQSTNCITKRCLTTTKNREFDIADTQHCVLFL